MKARLLKHRPLIKLKENIASNLERYRSGNFDFLNIDINNSFIELDTDMNDEAIQSITCSTDDHNEIECCKLMDSAFQDLSPYLARDERLWVYVTHTILLEYARMRWPIPDDDEKAIKHIQTHFFIRGSRGFERDNAAARLWWMAYICKKAEDIEFGDALTAFLYMTDVRANIVERPTTSQNSAVFGAIIRKLFDSYQSDKALYGRDVFRAVMKELNLKGGVTLLNAYSKDKVERLLDECILRTS